MYTKAKKTICHVTPQRPMTDEEKQARIMQFLTQKRETFSLTILKGLCSNPAAVGKKSVISENNNFTEISEISNGNYLVEVAVEMADALMEKLYPMPEDEKPKEETPAEKERERLKGNLKEEVCASDVCAYRGKNVCTVKRDEYCPMFSPKEDKE